MKKVSVVIITQNEEDRLADALKSCMGVADEIVVIDGYSTDKTCDIARQYDAKIYQNTFVDFGSQKNYALDKAQNEWILNLDSDERISERLKQEILLFKESETDDADGYRINRMTFYMGKWIKHCGWYPDQKLRFFKKSKSRWQGRVHEALLLDGKTLPMAGDIIHYTYRDITDHINRLNKYSKMQAQDISAKKKKFLYLRLLVLPPITFLRFYVWKLGVLDGLPGFAIAMISSWATAMKYIKAIELNRKK